MQKGFQYLLIQSVVSASSCKFVFFKTCSIYLFTYGCAGSLSLSAGFLQLWRVGLLFVALLASLVAASGF